MAQALLDAVLAASGDAEGPALYKLFTHLENATTPRALARAIGTQGCLNCLVAYALDRRFGSNERLGMETPRRLGQRASIDERSAGSGMSIAVLLNQLIGRFKSLALCTSLMHALMYCAVTTTKPVVRQNTFTHLFDWVKDQLATDGNNDWLFTAESQGRVDDNYVSPADASGASMVDQAPDDAPVVLVGPVNFEVQKAVMLRGMVDVWSAIRKACATRLFSVVDLLPLPLVRRVYCDLVAVATAPETDHNSWRRKEGALLGMAMVVKRFRRTGAAEHVGPASSNDSSHGRDGSTHSSRRGGGRHGPSLAPIPDSPKEEAAARQEETDGASGRGPPAATGAVAPAQGDKRRSGGTVSGGGSRRRLGGHTSMRRVQSELPGAMRGRKRADTPATLAFALRNAGDGTSGSPRVVIRNGPPVGPSESPLKPRATGEATRGASGRAGRRGSGDSSGARRRPRAGAGGAGAGASAGSLDHPVLNFGSSRRMQLPLFITGSMRRVVYPMLEHEQLSVRENAIRLFAAFLVRVGMGETLLAFKEVLNMLRGEGVEGWKRRLRKHNTNGQSADDGGIVSGDAAVAGLDDEGLDEEHPDFIPDVDEDNMLVPDPYTAEGVLGISVIIVRLAPLAIFLRSWSVIFPSVLMYLSHPASTVRQMASKVFLQISAKGRDKGNIPLLPWVLKGLAANWPVDPGFFSNTDLTGEAQCGRHATAASHTRSKSRRASHGSGSATTQAVARLRRSGSDTAGDHPHKSTNPSRLRRSDSADSAERRGHGHGHDHGHHHHSHSHTHTHHHSSRHNQLSWEGREGWLLTYELLLNFLLTSHRKRLHPFASLTDLKPHVAASGKLRRNSHGASVSSMGSDLSRLTVTGLMASGVSRPASTASMAHAYAQGSSDGVGTAFPPTRTPAKSGSGRRASPGPSPWLSPNTMTPAGVGQDAPTPGAPGSGSSAPTPAAMKLRKFRHGDAARSLLDVLRHSDMNIGAAVIEGVAVDTAVGEVPDGRRLLMSQALRRVLLQTKECLAESRFELRRMADQVLPLLTEVVMWFDLSLLEALWEVLPRFISARDSRSCLMAARTMSVMLRRARQLQLNVQAVGPLPGDSPDKSAFGPHLRLHPHSHLARTALTSTTASAGVGGSAIGPVPAPAPADSDGRPGGGSPGGGSPTVRGGSDALAHASRTSLAAARRLFHDPSPPDASNSRQSLASLAATPAAASLPSDTLLTPSTAGSHSPSPMINSPSGFGPSLASPRVRRERVLLVVRQLEAMLLPLFDTLQMLAALAPSDSVLALACELLVILQAYYGFGGDVDMETVWQTPRHHDSSVQHFNLLWRQRRHIRLVANRLGRVLSLSSPTDPFVCVPPSPPAFLSQWQLRHKTTPSPGRSPSARTAISPQPTLANSAATSSVVDTPPVVAFTATAPLPTDVTRAGVAPPNPPLRGGGACINTGAAPPTLPARAQPSGGEAESDGATALSPTSHARARRLGLHVDIPTTPTAGDTGGPPTRGQGSVSFATAVSTPATLGSVFSARSSTPGTVRVNPSRHRRAVVLDKNLASSLAPLLPDLMTLVTVGEAVAMLPTMLHWVLHYAEEKLRLTLLDAISRALDNAFAATPLPCGMFMTIAPPRRRLARTASGATSDGDAASNDGESPRPTDLASLRTSPSGRALAALRQSPENAGAGGSGDETAAADGVQSALDPVLLLRTSVWGTQPPPFVYAPDTARVASELQGMFANADAQAPAEAATGAGAGVGAGAGPSSASTPPTANKLASTWPSHASMKVTATPGHTLVAPVSPHVFVFPRSSGTAAGALPGSSGADGEGQAASLERLPTLTLEEPQPETLVRTHERVLAASALCALRLGRLLQAPAMEAPVLRGVLAILSHLCSQTLSPSILYSVLTAVAERGAEHYTAPPHRRESVSGGRPPGLPRGPARLTAVPPSTVRPITVGRGVSLSSLCSAHSASSRSIGSNSSAAEAMATSSAAAAAVGALGEGAGSSGALGVMVELPSPGAEDDVVGFPGGGVAGAAAAGIALSSPPPAQSPDAGGGDAGGVDTAGDATPGSVASGYDADGGEGASGDGTAPSRGMGRLYASALVPPAINQLRSHHIPSPISMSGAVPRSPSGTSSVLWRGPPPSSNLRLAQSSSRPKALSLEEDVLEVGVDANAAAISRRRSSKELNHIREEEEESHDHPHAMSSDAPPSDAAVDLSPVKAVPVQSSSSSDADDGSDWDDWDDWDEEEDDNQESNEALLELGSFLRKLAVEVDARWDAIAGLCTPGSGGDGERPRSRSLASAVVTRSVLGTGFFCAVVQALPAEASKVIVWLAETQDEEVRPVA